MRYRYALDRNDNLVDVVELTREKAQGVGPFVCVGCREQVFAKLKKQRREKHFSHHATYVRCNEETYLHKLGKRVFYETYVQCLDRQTPFVIEMVQPIVCSKFSGWLGRSCDLGEEIIPYDLTRLFDIISVEERDNDFVPDLTLFNKSDLNKRMYVEIAVTHEISEEKRKSGAKIIEIPISTEHDLQKITSRILRQPEVVFYNFKTKPFVVVDNAKCKCASQVHYCVFVVKDKDHYSYLLCDDSLEALEEKRISLGNRVVDRVLDLNQETWLDTGQVLGGLILKTWEHGFQIKDCLVCKLRNDRWGGTRIAGELWVWCRKMNKAFRSDYASNCEYFWLNEKAGRHWWRSHG